MGGRVVPYQGKVNHAKGRGGPCYVYGPIIICICKTVHDTDNNTLQISANMFDIDFVFDNRWLLLENYWKKQLFLDN